MPLQIISQLLLSEYLKELPSGLENAFECLQDAELSTPSFSFYTSVASVFSSKIEGENIEIDSFIKYKRDGLGFQPDYTKKIDDLYAAYIFAQEHTLNEYYVAKAHQLLSQNLLVSAYQGKLRSQNMYVSTEDGKIEYVAASPFVLKSEMSKFYADIDTLLNTQLSFAECFYYAAMIHLVFVKIHPWNDGNGRTGRLLEKWFLSEKLGKKAWFINAEKHYYCKHQEYYHNLRLLGLEYETLDYGQSLPFLMMLPNSLFTK